MKRKPGDRIEAEVVLRRSDESKSIKQPIRADSVTHFVPAKERVERIMTTLRKLGFEVVAEGVSSISIAGPKILFDRFFKSTASANFENESLDIPDSMKDEVEGIYIQDPPTYFQH